MVVDTFTGGAMNIEKSVSSGFCCCFLQFGHGIYTRDNLPKLDWNFAELAGKFSA